MYVLGCNSLAISTLEFGLRTPELGRTQYFFGAVVFILNSTVSVLGFVSRMYVVYPCSKSPEKSTKKINNNDYTTNDRTK